MAKAKTEVIKRSLPKVPKSKLWHVAKKIASMPKDTEAIYNTLVGIYGDGFGDGYERNTDDRRYFKCVREAERVKSFDSFLDSCDDLIHDKSMTA